MVSCQCGRELRRLVNLTILASRNWATQRRCDDSLRADGDRAADPLNPSATRDYCRVLGAVAPMDPNAPPVNFEVNLPAGWNGKAGAIWRRRPRTGVLITGPRAAARRAPVTRRCRWRRGFATWGTDSGTTTKNFLTRGPFALNDESLVNMAYAAYKKTHDVGVRIARACLRSAPAKIYFYGGSE